MFIPFWHLQRLLKRDESLWVFGAWKGTKITDNTFAFYKYIKENQPQIQAVWLTRSSDIKADLSKQGIEVYLCDSWEAFKISLRAGKVFACSGKEDVNRFAINGAISYQLWHGLPLKKISLDDRFSDHNSAFNRLKKWIFPFQYEFNWDFVLNTAPVFEGYFSSAFGVTPSQVLTTGYPRNDVLFSGESAKLVDDIREKYAGVQVLAYIPTFRSEKEETDLFTPYGFDLQEAEAVLSRLNAVLLIKAHPVQAGLFPIEQLKEDSRIIPVKDHPLFDMNTLLMGCDILLTDYSSVFFDFLLCDRQIIFTPFDLKAYLSQHRELYFKYEDAVPGPICSSWPAVWEAIEAGDSEIFAQLREEKRDLYHTYQDGNSRERLFELIRA